MLHRIEEKRNLVIVLKFARSFQVIYEPQNFLVPLVSIVHTCKFNDRRAVERGLLVRFNPLIVSEIVPAELKLHTVRGSHPFVVEINDVAVGAVVDDQRNNATFAVRKFLRKLQDITDSRSTETIQALIIITDHADVLAFSGKKEHKLFLDEVCVLVLIDHDVCDLGAHFLQNLLIILEKVVGFNLDR